MEFNSGFKGLMFYTVLVNTSAVCVCGIHWNPGSSFRYSVPICQITIPL